jgi:hypothetical protein
MRAEWTASRSNTDLGIANLNYSGVRLSTGFSTSYRGCAGHVLAFWFAAVTGKDADVVVSRQRERRRTRRHIDRIRKQVGIGVRFIAPSGIMTMRSKPSDICALAHWRHIPSVNTRACNRSAALHRSRFAPMCSANHRHPNVRPHIV